MFPALGHIAQTGMKGRSSAPTLTTGTSPALMHIPLENTQKKKKKKKSKEKNLIPPHPPPPLLLLGQLVRRCRFFSIYFFLKKTTHLDLIKSIYVGMRLINSLSTQEPSHCVRLNEVLKCCLCRIWASCLQTTLGLLFQLMLRHPGSLKRK